MSLGNLVLIRHGESEWNLLGKWTGWTDVSLTPKGASDAVKMGELVKDIKFDFIYTSTLKRSIETMKGVMSLKNKNDLEFTPVKAIDERDYGDYTGMNKWEVKERVGEAKFNAIRRNFKEPIPNGETLADVYNRAVPWYKEEVIPKLLDGKNVLIVAHGNSIRALVKYIENISDDDISKFEMPFGKILIYQVDDLGHIKNRSELTAHITPTKA